MTARASVAAARRVVIKVGSQLLNAPGGGVDTGCLSALAAEIAAVRDGGRDVVVVSSGAIAWGWPRLGLRERPRALPALQAAAAAGQSLLMRSWEEALAPFGISCAQVLLTHGDVADRRRYLNARETMETLLRYRVVPVINENDTIASEEIRYGDNDNLSADVAVLTSAQLLLVLTSVDGLMTADPRKDAGAQRIPEITDIDAQALPVAGGGTSELGTGGMLTKIEAARKATASGIEVVISDGARANGIAAVLAGEDVGTWFRATADPLSARKHWIAYTLKPGGVVIVDAGARTAVAGGGKSLLPSGVRRVEGSFSRGTAVALRDLDDVEFARGLSAYSADELRRIAGCRSSEIVGRLGYTFGDEVVHRDDLVLI